MHLVEVPVVVVVDSWRGAIKKCLQWPVWLSAWLKPSCISSVSHASRINFAAAMLPKPSSYNSLAWIMTAGVFICSSRNLVAITLIMSLIILLGICEVEQERNFLWRREKKINSTSFDLRILMYVSHNLWRLTIVENVQNPLKSFHWASEAS